MRNLYKRLGLSKAATTDNINQSIIRCSDRSVKADAESVLLDASSKKLYDQTHSTLESIATLRNGFGLKHTQLWDSSLDSEFNVGRTIPLRLKGMTSRQVPPKNASRSNGGKPKQSSNVMGWFVVIIVIVFALAALIDTKSSDSSYQPQPQPSTRKAEPVPVFNEPPVAMPQHGAIMRYHSSSALAPLKISTSSGSYYFVKMESLTTGQPTVELFIQGGRTIEIKMPLGSYTMKYSVGSTWYGREHRFGPNTSYLAESTFRFTEDYSGYSGYTVTLYSVVGGNMDTSKIDDSSF